MTTHHGTPTANDRLKERSRAMFWECLALATVLHFAIFAFAPEISVAEIPTVDEKPTQVFDIPETDLPESPPPIQRPPTPVFTLGAPDVALPPNVLPMDQFVRVPPPAPDDDATAGFEWVAPSMVRPRLLNRAEVQAAILREYPPLLQDAGIGGTVTLHFWIDEAGRVVRTEVGRTSGQPALDSAAAAVAEVMRFAPALSRDRPVPVIVAVPVTFEAR